MSIAPICLFVYNRPWHTEQTLNALATNDLADQSILYIYSDGPKHLALEEDVEKIDKVREIIKSQKWCKDVIIIESAYNKGLADSIINGVTEVVNKHGKIIVLEDDLITSKGFLKFINEGLDEYENDPQVMHISGYMYPAIYAYKSETYFLNILSCWGWGTWRHAWQNYNHDVQDHLAYFSSSKKRIKKFDIEGHAYYYKQLLKNANGELYTWAVRWYASWLRAGGYSLFPSKSLVQNIGHDGSGVHCNTDNFYKANLANFVKMEKVPIIENITIRKQVDKFYQKKLKIKTNIKLKIKRQLCIYFKAIGVGKLRLIFRWILRKIYPELVLFEDQTFNWRTFISTQKSSNIAQSARLYPPYHLKESEIGDCTYVSKNSSISKTHIGKFCSIGPNLVCGWGVHPVDGISTHPMFYSTMKQNGMTLSTHNKVQERKPINIGNDVFIGMNVTILDGVTIGDGAVIGAGAVVSKDIPPYAIAVGNPIKIIRYRFEDGQIQKLLAIKWWDLDQPALRDVEKHIFDVQTFIDKYYF